MSLFIRYEGVSTKAAKEMKNALKNMNKDEMKEALKKMKKEELKAVLKVMNKEELKEVIANMSKEDLKAVLKTMTKDELKTVLGNMSKEDLKAVLNSMSKEELQEALKNMTEEELKEALKKLSKEEIRALKAAGKLDGIKGIDKLLEDARSTDEDSDSDGEGKGKRKKKKKRSDSAFSYYSYTSEGGTRYVRRRRRRPDGTYSDSESCPSDEEARRAGSGKSKKSKKSISKKDKTGEGGQGEKDKKGAKKKGGKGEKGGGRGGGEGGGEGGEGGKGKGKGKKGGKGGEGGEEDGDSDFSIRSEVSEGGTRRQVKMKRIRDEDGNVVGYGDPVPYDYRAESVAGRRGSLESISNRETTLEREDRRKQMQRLEEQVKLENERAEKEAIKKKYQEEKEKANLQRKQDREKARASLQGKDLLTGKQGGGDGDPNFDDLLMVQGQGDGEAGGDGIPSDFSGDSSDDDDVDLSKMTEAEKKAYFAEKEKKRQMREARRREKYGDKYDEIMKKKNAKKEQAAKEAAEEQARQEELQRQEEARMAAEEERKRRSSLKTTTANMKTKEKPKSMVTYDKGPPRWPQNKEPSNLSRDQAENRHERRNSKVFTSDGQQRSRGGNEEFEGTKFLKLPPINKNKRGSFSSDDGDTKKRGRRMHPRGETIDKNVAKSIAEKTVKEKDDEEFPDDDMIEVDESGKLRLKKGKKIDLSKMSDDMLRKLGIDPNLSSKEKAKLLKKLFGDDIEIHDKGLVVGTKGLEDYDLEDMTDDMLADDPNLDIDTLTGQRRVNILMRRGGMLLKEHMTKVIDMSKLAEEPAYRTDLDEKGDIDFMHHYRLVDPSRIETYAKAFVVEDGDLDTVINLKEMITALDGVPTMNTMTEKQYDYVFKVLNINDATQVTFRMFAVFTALCERVTCMDNLSKHLLEICNLADIERKLDLYRSMFYHNIQSGLDPNYITSDSLKIELIAGGLSWLQQQYVAEKMEVNIAGNISFLDYMCYIPLFMSMHDNIVDNPLDMSDQKYSVPPRTRPASAQRDINPLGFPLSKNSSLQMRQKAKDLQEGKLKPSDVSSDVLEKLHKFAKLPEIKPMKRTSTSTTRTSLSSVDKIDLIF